MKHLIIISAIILLSSISCFSQSSVWKVEANGNVLYLGGSIHILRDQDYPLPFEFYEAYESSDILTTEMDMNSMNDPANGVKMQQTLMYQDQRTLSSVLNKDVYHQLDSVCESLGLNLKAMDKFKPSMVIISLTYQSLQKLGVTTDGVDVHFTTKAIQDKKKLLYLETFDEQLGFIKSMGKGDENEFVRYSIEDIENNEDDFLDLINEWKSGKQELLNEQLLEFKSDYPDIYNTMLAKRNNNWMTHLEKYLETPEVEFVVAGAMHMVGPDGLLNQLEKKGYKVSQLQ